MIAVDYKLARSRRHRRSEVMRIGCGERACCKPVLMCRCDSGLAKSVFVVGTFNRRKESNHRCEFSVEGDTPDCGHIEGKS